MVSTRLNLIEKDWKGGALFSIKLLVCGILNGTMNIVTVTILIPLPTVLCPSSDHQAQLCYSQYLQRTSVEHYLLFLSRWCSSVQQISRVIRLLFWKELVSHSFSLVRSCNGIFNIVRNFIVLANFEKVSIHDRFMKIIIFTKHSILFLCPVSVL